MKKVLIVLMVALSASSINAQTGKVNLEELAPVLYAAIGNNTPLVIETFIVEQQGDNHDALLGQVASAHGVLVKQGANFSAPAPSTIETTLYTEGGQERAILRYTSSSNGVNYTISARCGKTAGKWYFISDILPTNQTNQN